MLIDMTFIEKTHGKRKVPNKKNQLIGSYLFDYQFENNIHECPYISMNEMFDVNQVLNSI